jgi:hypothetical protein
MRIFLAAAGAALALALSAAPALVRAQSPVVPSWIVNDAAEKSTVVDIQAAWNSSAGGLNFNGYYQGEARLVVPVGWRVQVKFFNSSLDLAHSIVVTKPFPAGSFPIEAGPGDAAIPRAYTKSPVTGVYNDGDDFSFTASESRAGDYYIFCGVSTHGVAGMWIWLSIRPDADMPHLMIEKQPAKPGRP